jgi:hypothetical protein
MKYCVDMSLSTGNLKREEKKLNEVETCSSSSFFFLHILIFTLLLKLVDEK